MSDRSSVPRLPPSGSDVSGYTGVSLACQPASLGIFDPVGRERDPLGSTNGISFLRRGEQESGTCGRGLGHPRRSAGSATPRSGSGRTILTAPCLGCEYTRPRAGAQRWCLEWIPSPCAAAGSCPGSGSQRRSIDAFISLPTGEYLSPTSNPTSRSQCVSGQRPRLPN